MCFQDIINKFNSKYKWSGVWEGFGAFDGDRAEHSKIEEEKLFPIARIESSIIQAWEHSNEGKKKSTTHPFY